MSKKSKILYYKENFYDLSVKIPWKYYVAVLKELGFEMGNKRGSARFFVKSGVRFTADEPHGKGDPFVYKCDREKAIAALERLKGEES